MRKRQSFRAYRWWHGQPDVQATKLRIASLARTANEPHNRHSRFCWRSSRTQGESLAIVPRQASGENETIAARPLRLRGRSSLATGFRFAPSWVELFPSVVGSGLKPCFGFPSSRAAKPVRRLESCATPIFIRRSKSSKIVAFRPPTSWPPSVPATAGPAVTVLFDDGTHFTFNAFAPNFTGGVNVVLGRVNGNTVPDVVVGAGRGGGPQVAVFDGQSLLADQAVMTANFFAFNPGFSTGVVVATGRINGSANSDVIAALGPGGPSEVSVFDGAQLAQGKAVATASFSAFAPSFVGGVSLAVGPINGTSHSDLIIAAGPAADRLSRSSTAPSWRRAKRSSLRSSTLFLRTFPAVSPSRSARSTGRPIRTWSWPLNRAVVPRSWSSTAPELRRARRYRRRRSSRFPPASPAASRSRSATSWAPATPT